MRRFAGLLALGAVCIAAPVFAAVDLGSLFKTAAGQKEYCVWSNAHIVFDNNTVGPVDLVMGESVARPDGTTTYADLYGTFQRGETKKYYDPSRVIYSVTVKGVKTSVGPLTFSSCNEKDKYPAYRVVIRKDFTVDYWARSKTTN